MKRKTTSKRQSANTHSTEPDMISAFDLLCCPRPWSIDERLTNKSRRLGSKLRLSWVSRSSRLSHWPLAAEILFSTKHTFLSSAVPTERSGDRWPETTAICGDC